MSSATNAQCTRSLTRINGLFNRQQMEHFWTNFNYDLYNRICEIKYSEL
jgi:phosphatidylserine decarboxylase